MSRKCRPYRGFPTRATRTHRFHGGLFSAAPPGLPTASNQTISWQRTERRCLSRIRGGRYTHRILVVTQARYARRYRGLRNGIKAVLKNYNSSVTNYDPRVTNHDSRITHHQSRFFPQHAKSACHPVPAECQALLGKTLRQLFAFACPSYPCSGFPEPTGAATTHPPLGSRNSSPMT